MANGGSKELSSVINSLENLFSEFESYKNAGQHQTTKEATSFLKFYSQEPLKSFEVGCIEPEPTCYYISETGLGSKSVYFNVDGILRKPNFDVTDNVAISWIEEVLDNVNSKQLKIVLHGN